MTNQQHPITPPPELFNKLKEEWAALGVKIRGDLGNYLVNNAYRIGADQELKACCEWLDYNCPSVGVHHLRLARRPKSLSVKEQALKALERQSTRSVPSLASTNDCDTIRLALEALPND
jgi:hypothetical protein